MKAVCHITFSEFPADGRVKRYVNSLLKEGYFVCVICKSDPYGKKKEAAGNLYIRRLNVQKKRGSYISRTLEYILFFVKASSLALYYFFKYRVRTYHAHTLPDFVSLTAFLPSMLGAKVILDLHEFTPELLMHRKKLPANSMLIRFSRLVEKISVWFADELITIHEGVVELIGKRNNRELIEIINGIEENEYAGFEKTDTETFDIVYNGTINDTINLEDTVYALAKVRETIPAEEFCKIKFNIFGTGPMLELILEETKKHRLEDTVIYHGKIPYYKMIEELKKMDVSVQPLHRVYATDMSYPIKIPELVNLRIPVIISRLDTMLRYYDEDCFFYFNGGDINSFAERIIEVKSSPVKAREKTEAALKAYDKISWEKVMKPRYLELVGKIAA
jgi:glycosyltransferase involved in cell wall biosynthesis